MDLDKYEKLVDNKLGDMSDTQLLKLYKDIDEKVRQDSFNTFIKYNNRDTKIVGDLNEKLNFIQVALTFAHVSKSNPSDIFGTVKPWDNMLYSRLHDKGIQIHPNETHQNSGSFLGGYVKDPKLGRSNWVVSFDLNSLYPSIIMMLNMSYETIRLKSNRDLQDIIEKMLKFEYDTKIAHDKEYTIAANGSMYDKSFIGIIPETMSYLFDTRKRIKREMKDIEREIEKLKSDKNADKTLIKKLKDKVSAMDALQHAYKILANSGYGAIGNETFRYYKNEIAEGITATGQLSIKYISNEINNFLNEKIGTQDIDYVVANDTDSAYICLDNWVHKNNYHLLEKNEIIDKIDEFCKKEIEPHIEKSYAKLSKYLNSIINRLVMKREAIADCAIWRAKKNYIINLYDNEDVRFNEPKLKMMGIETNRTSSPLIVRKKLEECLKLIVDEDEKQLREKVKEFKKEYNSLSATEIASPRGVKNIEKWLDKDNNIVSGCPIHVRASIAYNNYVESRDDYKIACEKIKSGDKIKFVELVANNPVGDYVIAFPDTLPDEFGIDKYIDRKKMFDGTFLNPLESFTSLVGYNIRHSNSFFNNTNVSHNHNDGLKSNENTTVNDVKKTFKKPKRRGSLF